MPSRSVNLVFMLTLPARKVPVKEHKLALSMSIYSNLGQYKYDFYAFIPHKLWNLCVN
jgi:hypothetical protein